MHAPAVAVGASAIMALGPPDGDAATQLLGAGCTTGVPAIVQASSFMNVSSLVWQLIVGLAHEQAVQPVGSGTRSPFPS